MVNVNFHKVVWTLPWTLEANSIYFVKIWTWFNVYVTNDTWDLVAYPINSSWKNLFIQDTQPTVSENTLWINTTWWNIQFNLVTP